MRQPPASCENVDRKESDRIVSKLEFDLGLDSGDGIDELVVRSFGEKLRLQDVMDPSARLSHRCGSS